MSGKVHVHIDMESPASGWCVRRHLASELAFPAGRSRAEAIAIGRELSRRESLTLVVHRADGTVDWTEEEGAPS